MKDVIKEVIGVVKSDLPLELSLKIDGDIIDVDVIEIDETSVRYIHGNNVESLKFKDFRSDLIRYNRFLVDYIAEKII